MACKNCGSDWLDGDGNDCNKCPHCCKGRRSDARKKGLWPSSISKVCRICGVEFSVNPNRHRATVCDSETCQKKSRSADARVRVARWRTGLSTKRLPAAPKKVCKREGCNAFVKVNCHQYCSKACRGADARELKCDWGGVPREVRKAAAFASWFVDMWDAQRPRLRSDYKPRPPCQVCGKETNSRSAKCCSYACKKLWRGQRKCVCGGSVENAMLFGRVSCEACKRLSRRIQRRMYGCYRRRCRTYGGFFNSAVKPLDVFQRDAFVCHICHRKTHRVFRNDDPLSATVDHHPVPLSKGGDHDWYNVRCACKSCNEQKGNKWDGQSRLRLKVS
jgi:hypothetical protein